MVTAGVTHDLELDYQGYMLACGGAGRKNGLPAYWKGARGGAASGAGPETQPQVARRRLWGNWRGQGARYLTGGESGASWESSERAGLVAELSRLRPVLGGAALALAPQSEEALVDPAAFGYGGFHSLALGGVQVVALHDRLFVSASPGTNGSGFVMKKVGPGVITGLCAWNNTALASCGGTLYTFDPAGGTLTPFGTNCAVGRLAVYQGAIVGAAGASLYYYLPGAGSWQPGPVLESAVTAIEELDGALYIGTQTGLYRLEGTARARTAGTAPDWLDYRVGLAWRATAGEPAGGPAGQNFAGLAAWQGGLWFWAAGRLWQGRPQGNGLLELEGQPLYGRCYGLAVCGGSLAALLEPAGGPRQLYLNDGLGWWKLGEGSNWRYIFPNAGYAAGAINLASDAANNYTFVRWLVDGSSPLGFRGDNFGLPRREVTGRVMLPLLFPADLAGAGRLEAIVLQSLGVEWSLVDAGAWWPELDETALEFSLVTAEFSPDGGRTWESVPLPGEPPGYGFKITPENCGAGRTEFNLARVLRPPTYPLAGRATGQALPDPGWLLRVTFSGYMMPLLKRVWLDYRPVELASRTGLAWEMELDLGAPLGGLDGRSDPEEPLAKLARLWELWRSGETVVFEDLDGQSYYVQVAGLEQRPLAPPDPNLKAAWSAQVKLVEIFRQ